MPKIVRSISDLRANLSDHRTRANKIALVPTMGALHDGHLSLVRDARAQADIVVVSIFVNPTQFAAGEDLSRYPRDEEGDIAKLRDAKADLVWTPSEEDMYPTGFATTIEIKGPADTLEGQFRPTHFSGVATVVCKLLSAVSPDLAIFGEKDFQQLAVIRRLVRDLNLPVEIAGAATVREEDGLALSSRNSYLSEAERAIAPLLNQVITDVASCKKTTTDATAALLAAGFTKVDYIEVRDAETLEKPSPDRPARVLAAAWLGKTRLIDNVPA